MTRRMRVFVIASFVVLYGIQAVMFAFLMKPQGIRMHAPIAGIAVPRETTVVGDAWIRDGIARIEVRIRDEATGVTWTVPAERDAIRYQGRVVSLLAAWRTKVVFPSDARYSLSAAAIGGDGRVVETRARAVSASASAASREFVFLSPAHLAALAIVLALLFLPVLYFSRDGFPRQVLFELLFFFGLAGAMQALFTPDIGIHGFSDFKYFNYFFSHGTIVLGLVCAAVLYRFELTWKSWIRISVGTIGMCLVMFGVNRLFLLIPPCEVGNYFVMGYPPPTGSVIDVFASVVGPAPRYLVGLSGMGLVLLGILYLPYPIRRMIRRRAAVRSDG